MEPVEHNRHFINNMIEALDQLDPAPVLKLVEELIRLRQGGGRVFVLGVGGSAANCSHVVNDLRKLCGIEAYAPTDNVAELTARTNDDGWDSVFFEWLIGSRLKAADAVLILSVGGGDEARKVSVNLIKAIDHARSVGARVWGIVGRAEGYTARSASVAVVVPSPEPKWITPTTESIQAVIWHCIVSHPRLQRVATKW